MAQLARFSPAAVVQRITRGGDALAEPPHSIDEIVVEAVRHRPTIDQGLIRRAYDTAVTAHEGQLRSSGEEYVSHPVAVTYYLATLQMDAETLAAALLHDVPESNPGTPVDDPPCHPTRTRDSEIEARGAPPFHAVRRSRCTWTL